MNAAEALTFITDRLCPDDDPQLSLEVVESLLPLAACVDEDGRTPDDPDWTPTYSTVGCYRAIAEGYGIKHAKAANRFDFTTDGQTFRRSQILDHLEFQRSLYARKVQQSPSTLGGGA